MKLLLSSALLATTTFSAAAAEPGPYIGVAAVAAHHDYSAAADGGDLKSNKVGRKIYAGYQIDPTWAVEAGFTDFSNSDCKCTFANQPADIESRAKSWYVAGKGSYPITGPLSLTGKLGLAVNQNEVKSPSANAWSRDRHRKELYTAIGVDYAINEKVTTSLGLERYGRSEANDAGAKPLGLSLGLQYGL